jgi:hypothetical protein
VTYKDRNTGEITVKSTTSHKFKVFMAWQDQEEEVWLRQMAQQGYHLSSMVFPAVYEFTVGEPRDVIYQLDYTNVKRGEVDAYLQLFEDAGWECVGTWLGWYYFRKAADSGSPNEIYTDVESKIQKYQRLLTYLVIFPIILAASITSLFTEPSIPLLEVFFVLLFIFWLYVLGNLLRRIRQLKRL